MRGQPLLPARRGWGNAAPGRGSPVEAGGACPGPFSSLPAPAERLLPGRAAPWLRLALVPAGGRGALAAAERPLAAAAAAAPPTATCHKSRGAQPAPAFQASPAPRQLSRPVPATPDPPQPLTAAGGAARTRRRLPAP